MTRAALTVMAAEPGRPFALFVEAGDVDFGLHENNLDNAVGSVLSGEEAIRVVFDWVAQHSNWDESVVIVTSDHGCDPTTPSTDHSREHAMLLAYAQGRNANGARHDGEFADVGATVNAWLGGKAPGRRLPGQPIIEP